MALRTSRRPLLGCTLGLLACSMLTATVAVAHDSGDDHRAPLVLTSTNNPAGNQVLVFRLSPRDQTLPLTETLPSGGKGGAAGNAGILQFRRDFGAVANYGSNTVTELVREGDFIAVQGNIALAPGCRAPDSVALTQRELFVAGANCLESHAWPSGRLDGAVVPLDDPSAGQVAIGKTWGALTLKSGSVLAVGLTDDGALAGSATSITLPSSADSVPLGAAFWGNVLGFTAAHSPDSFAVIDAARQVYPVAGPTPSFPSNAPCWIAKGPGNVWYTGNTPDHAISIFFSDAQGGAFYKSVPLPGAPTDLAVSPDGKWLAVIYAASTGAYVSVFAIDAYGGLTLRATSEPLGITSFNGVAISE